MLLQACLISRNAPVGQSLCVLKNVPKKWMQAFCSSSLASSMKRYHPVSLHISHLHKDHVKNIHISHVRKVHQPPQRTVDPEFERLEKSFQATLAKPVPKGPNKLIYSVTISKYIHAVNITVILSAIYGWYNTPDVLVGTLEVDDFTYESLMYLCCLFMLDIGCPLLFYRYYSRFVLKMYYNEGTDTYTTFLPNGRFGSKKYFFSSSDVKPTVVKRSMFRDVHLRSFTARNRRYVVNADFFSLPIYYNRLMGYV